MHQYPPSGPGFHPGGGGFGLRATPVRQKSMIDLREPPPMEGGGREHLIWHPPHSQQQQQHRQQQQQEPRKKDKKGKGGRPQLMRSATEHDIR